MLTVITDTTQKNIHSTKAITFEEAKNRLIAREDIEICEVGFMGWKKKSKFYDKIIKDYFWSIPRDILANKTGHPLRTKEKRKNTYLEKYGVDNPQKHKTIREKTEITCLKKFGETSYLTTKEKQVKGKITSFKKYGTEFSAQANARKMFVKLKDFAH